MKTKLLAAVIALLSAELAAPAVSTVTGPVSNPANGHFYYLLTPSTWTDAEGFATTLGGHLTTINNSAENTWVGDTFYPYLPVATSDPQIWIGLYNPSQNLFGGTHASNFVWSNGEAVSFTYWYSGLPEPDNTGGDEFYGTMRSPNDPELYAWNDLNNTGGGGAGNVWGVVEVVPEPSLLAPMAIGLLAVGACRRSRRA